MNKNALLGCWVDDGGGDTPGMLSIIISKNDKLLNLLPQDFLASFAKRRKDFL